jgi:hypothetical protein
VKKYRVITRAGDRVIHANSVEYVDNLIIFYKGEEIVGTFIMDHVIGVIDEVG